MVMQIRCSHCGFCMGKYARAFDLMRAAYTREHIAEGKMKDYRPDKLNLISGGAPALEPIFIALGIKNYCCRMAMMCVDHIDKTQ